jgi:glycosyltransferase involved in cell wall biosynthesis
VQAACATKNVGGPAEALSLLDSDDEAGALNGSEAPSALISRPRVLHVSADFPDSVDALKTHVIRSLLDLTRESFQHEVVSLNRRSPSFASFALSVFSGAGKPRLSTRQEAFEYGLAMVYQAPPRGLFHATMLRRLGDWLAEEAMQAPLPDLLVGHKLAIEGIAVHRAAERCGLPYAICIQGDTDTKVMGARPDLTAALSRVFHGAALTFPFTPWALQQVEQRLGKRTGPTIMLPCPTDLDRPVPPRNGGDGLVTGFHLKNHSRKNLRGLAAALKILADEGKAMPLEIIGGGAPDDMERCRNIVAGLDSVSFAGALDRAELRARLNQATAFVLPSLRESFGLVFIEALFAGVPVIYPKGAAIDGYFDEAPFALRVDARNPVEIAAAMATVVREEARLKAELAWWQQSREAERFQRGAIARSFAQGLRRAADLGTEGKLCAG